MQDTKSSACSVVVSVLLSLLSSQTSGFASAEFLELCCIQSSALHIESPVLVYHCFPLPWIPKTLQKKRKSYCLCVDFISTSVRFSFSVQCLQVVFSRVTALKKLRSKSKKHLETRWAKKFNLQSRLLN